MSPGYESRRIDDLPRSGVSSKDGPGSVMVSDTLLPAEHLSEIKMKNDNREKIEDYLRFLTHAGETRFPIFA